MRSSKCGGSEVHAPLHWNYGAVSRYSIAHVRVLSLSQVRKGAKEFSTPAEDLFKAGMDVFLISLIIECWKAVSSNDFIEFLLSC